jgi:hypothetical protein
MDGKNKHSAKGKAVKGPEKEGLCVLRSSSGCCGGST